MYLCVCIHLFRCMCIQICVSINIYIYIPPELSTIFVHSNQFDSSSSKIVIPFCLIPRFSSSKVFVELQVPKEDHSAPQQLSRRAFLFPAPHRSRRSIRLVSKGPPVAEMAEGHSLTGKRLRRLHMS